MIQKNVFVLNVDTNGGTSMVVCYLIHFERPLGKSCQHYLGSTNNIQRRILEHKSGGVRAARLMKKIREEGIKWDVVKIWETTKEERYNLERKLKSQKNSRRFCSICREG